MLPYEAGNVYCPFYVKSKDLMISCEGMEEGIHCHQIFDSQKAKRQWMNLICNEDYHSCPYAKMLERKYEQV